jgi:hypothetical protein
MMSMQLDVPLSFVLPNLGYLLPRCGCGRAVNVQTSEEIPQGWRDQAA